MKDGGCGDAILMFFVGLILLIVVLYGILSDALSHIFG